MSREEAVALIKLLADKIAETTAEIPSKWSIVDAHGVSIIKLHGKTVTFSGKEKSIMECLVRANGEPVSYKVLHAAGWGDGFYDPDVIKDGIKNIKRTLKKMEVGSTVRIRKESAQLLECQGG